MKVRKIKTDNGSIYFPKGINVQDVKKHIQRANNDHDMTDSLVKAIKK